MSGGRGKLFVVSGPSGVGKSTVIRLVREMCGIAFSVSATTREMRAGEVQGIDYYYVTRERFHQMLEQGELLEHVEYVGNFYGTPIAPIRESLDNGRNILLDIEPHGAARVRELIPEAVLIYLTPKDFAQLEERLRGRKHDSEEAIQKRIAQARADHAKASEYDYIVVNDDLDTAVTELYSIITAEMCRVSQRIKLLGDADYAIPPDGGFSG